MKKVAVFLKGHIVFVIATLCAIVTSIIVPPDKEYLGYIDFKTLACLFATLCVVCALKNIKFFSIVSRKIIHSTPNFRICVLALIYITFIGSLFIANDMALITFLPLGWYVLSETGNEKYTPYLFVLQNISANLGGMLTPFGNPQNLYLYTKFDIPTGEFMKIMLPPFLFSVALLTVCAMFFPKTKMELKGKEYFVFKPKRTVIYLILFAISIIMVFSVIPYYIGLAIIFVSVLILDRYALLRVDYPLLLTFLMFFIFAGNMSRIDAVRELFSFLLEKNALVFSSLSCQIISNVPSAILLSQFTTDYRSLLYGVNIGGTGTIIASLASLITFSEFCRVRPKEKKKYFGIFTLFNIGFFVLLLGLCLLLV
ncbi:MAG: citrate transporter [Clostridia bacterium]|nr:citrate transporter [Clostridia bacterium]